MRPNTLNIVRISTVLSLVLMGLLNDAPVFGTQSDYAQESRDPYFQPPVIPQPTNKADLARVINGTANSVKQGWIQNPGQFNPSDDQTALNTSPSTSIIRATKDWNDQHVIKNDTFMPFASKSAKRAQSAAVPVSPPWRRGEFTFNLAAPNTNSKSPADTTTAAGDPTADSAGQFDNDNDFAPPIFNKPSRTEFGGSFSPSAKPSLQSTFQPKSSNPPSTGKPDPSFDPAANRGMPKSKSQVSTFNSENTNASTARHYSNMKLPKMKLGESDSQDSISSEPQVDKSRKLAHQMTPNDPKFQKNEFLQPVKRQPLQPIVSQPQTQTKRPPSNAAAPLPSYAKSAQEYSAENDRGLAQSIDTYDKPAVKSRTAAHNNDQSQGSDFQPLKKTEFTSPIEPAGGAESNSFFDEAKSRLTDQPKPAPKTTFSASSGGSMLKSDNDLAKAQASNPVLATKSQSFEPGQVLALVGGEPIFVGDILFDVNNFIKKAAPNAPESVIKNQRPLLIKRVLPRYIDSTLLYVATLRGLPEQVDIEKVLEQASEEFDDKAMKAMMEQSGTKSPAEFDAHLRMLGSSLRKMRQSWAKEQITRFFLSKQLNIDTDVTHQEMLDYYHQHETDYLIKARAKWEQIMVRFDKFSSRDDAYKAIVELGDKVVYGAKLDAVAKESSQGFRASQGGQHDWTSKNALVLKELDKAIFELPIGSLSDIIETRDGYHIVRVIEREDDSKMPFLEAQVEIRKKLETRKREAAFQDHLKKLKQEIPVEIFDVSTAEE